MKSVILWDNDGVLVRTEDFFFLATRHVLRDLDVDLDRDAYLRLFLEESVDPLHRVLGELGREADFGELHRIRLQRHVELLRTRDITVEGAADTVRALAGTHRMAVVTGAKRAHVEVLQARTDFFHLFDFIVTREDVTETKPSPVPYLQAVRRIGARVENCIAVEDSERGLRSAKAAGLECWIIPNGLTAGSSFGAADRILGDVREVRTLLDNGGAT